MAQATKESKIILEISAEEADYICFVTQNAAGSEESKDIKEIRSRIFNALAGLTDTYSAGWPSRES